MRESLFPLLLFIPLLYAGVWIHELSHALITISCGGIVLEIVVNDIFSGYIIGIFPFQYLFLIRLAGGIGQALYFSIAGKKIHPVYYITSISCVLYAFIEAFNSTAGILYFISSFFYLLALPLLIVPVIGRIADRY